MQNIVANVIKRRSYIYNMSRYNQERESVTYIRNRG
jgi:hypothetical protein